MAKRAKEEALDLVERRGFNGANATVNLVLVDADVERAAGAVKKCGKCATWRKGVYGKRVRAAKQGYMVYRLAGHGWSMAQSVSGKPVTYELARDVSRELGGRAMWLAVSDTASWTGYLLFNAGVLVEILEDYVDHHNNASHLPPDLVRSLTVQSTGHGIFGSSWRKVPLSKLKTPKDVDKLIDDLLRAENTLAPVSGEWNDEGGLVTLDLPYLSEEDVERLDFLGNGEVPPPTAAEQKAAAELERFRRLMGNRKPR